MILSSFRQISLPLLALSCTPVIVRSAPAQPPLPVTVDVAIVGAGLSGLTAASNLLAAKKTVLVFEARDRVGGKVFNHPLKNGGVTEVGAEFVGPTQDHVLKLIKDLGLETFETYNTGDSVLWRNNTRTVYTPDPALGGAPPVDGASLLQVAAAQQQLDEWAATIKPSSPFSHPKAQEWDSKTFEDFLHQATPSADANFVLTTACKSLFSAEPREISLLNVLIYIASAGNETTTGNLTRLVAVKDGGQESRVIGGTGLIPTRLADRVGSQHIALNNPVISITRMGSGYDVKSKHHTVHAKFVVLALAPPLLQKITFTPALPEARSALNKNMKMPALGKGIAIYKSPFWRTPTTAQKSGLSAQVLSDAGSVRATFDSTPHPSTKPAFAAIMGFLLGDEMRAIDAMSVPAAQAKIVDDYTRYFGAPAKDFVEFVLQRWDLEPFSLGGPVAIAAPGLLSKYGNALRQPVEGLHFAGTETADYWMGYMDGAIRSGERVAKEIITTKTIV
ncbi:hypothetical protein IAQ61_011961 [Plenodomus lingam]|uniref:Amine oxidase n=1 Tax=Leptosphaeria maculans (strain JN3 / isolate v23.1.3 / race Av1-4-5-6-7-8) TaxID=985895 RepID=E5ABM8_LEPMJ|nr:similar to monoamine oxidase A [Plenodomus lingam JN3]KAH9860177.1 hypothetical protein IAQ61_011961 [Plenodomus lingam]CBY01069.1 similar to monoamine oxidase A [Plenodomus lingam JN3]